MISQFPWVRKLSMTYLDPLLQDFSQDCNHMTTEAVSI